MGSSRAEGVLGGAGGGGGLSEPQQTKRTGVSHIGAGGDARGRGEGTGGQRYGQHPMEEAPKLGPGPMECDAMEEGEMGGEVEK